MKLANIVGALAAFLLAANIAAAQRPYMMEGNMGALRGIYRLNIRYDYSNMEVGQKTEREYIADKQESYNNKESGRGDKWLQEWIADRANRFQPAFEDEFNHDADIRLGNFPDEKYTMIFKTIFTEPGFNVGVARGNSYISADVLIVETANPDHVIAKIGLDHCPGRSFWGTDFDTGGRIQEAYTTAGRVLARFMMNRY